MNTDFVKICIPEVVPNWIGGVECLASGGETIPKVDPTTGRQIGSLTRSGPVDVRRAIEAAIEAQRSWAAVPPVRRGEILLEIALGLRAKRAEMARVVALETGKNARSALGETDGATNLGLFFAGEGQRLYSRTMTSGVLNRWNTTVREPVGIAGLIIAANTPVANVAWKVFPALICGNAGVLKAPEDTPGTAWLFAKIASEAGLPPGVLNIVQGLGSEAGTPLVDDPNVGVISFTGSTSVGKVIAQAVGRRLGKLSLELGGKNPFVVCDDADLPRAVEWAAQSAFSNAGQRCAAGSRIIVFEKVYESFRQLLLERTKSLKVGPTDADDFGPVINERQLTNMCRAIEKAKSEGAKVLIGGGRLTSPAHAAGFFMEPTVLEGVKPEADISCTELFGPITALYRVPDLASAIDLANHSPYGLTASIHTANVHRAQTFAAMVQAGIVSVNGGTFGSEPHMPFGGVKQSGNGTREPGTEALDIYSNLKNICINHFADRV